MSGERCLIFNWHNSRAASGILFFRVPIKVDEPSINWGNNIVAVITCDTVMKAISKEKLKTEHFELSYPQEKMIFLK